MPFRPPDSLEQNGGMPASLLVVEDDDTIRDTIREALIL